MTILTMPASPGLMSYEPSINQPTQVNKAEFTGRRRSTILAAAPRWSHNLKVVPIHGEAAFRPWRSFLVGLQGRAGSFVLPVTENPQSMAVPGAGGVRVDGGGQTGFVLATKNWQPGSYLPDGAFVTVGTSGSAAVSDQPIVLHGLAVAGSDGKAVLVLHSYLRLPSVDNALVEVVNPYAVMSRTEDSVGWTVTEAQEYAVAFPAEESW